LNDGVSRRRHQPKRLGLEGWSGALSAAINGLIEPGGPRVHIA
jgi:hypothetical protein